MGPAVLRGEQAPVDFYRELLRQRVKDGIGAIDDEKFRIYWDGMPVWGSCGNRPLVAELNTCVASPIAAAGHSRRWIQPIRLTAWREHIRTVHRVRDENFKEKYFEDQINRYKIDGTR